MIFSLLYSCWVRSIPVGQLSISAPNFRPLFTRLTNTPVRFFQADKNGALARNWQDTIFLLWYGLQFFNDKSAQAVFRQIQVSGSIQMSDYWPEPFFL